MLTRRIDAALARLDHHADEPADNRLTTPDDARLLLTLALSLAPDESVTEEG